MTKVSTVFLGKREASYLFMILLCALVFYGIFVVRTAFSINGETYFTLVDDAMISMRYARNLSEFGALVWNIGERPVEGFTNMGWTLYMAVLHKFPISQAKISLLVMVTSVLVLLGNALLAFALTRAISPASRRAPIIAMCVTAFYYPLVFWSLRGMEVGVSTFLIYASVFLAVTHTESLKFNMASCIGLLMAISLIVRFDAVLQTTLIISYMLYTYVIKQKASFGTVASVLIIWIAAIIGVLIFQYTYFGSVLPNTYFLKVDGVSLTERLYVGIQVFFAYASRDIFPPLFIVIAGMIIWKDMREKKTILMIALFLVQGLYSIYIGGDYAEPLAIPQVEAANRFITQGMPSLIILSAIAIDYFIRALTFSGSVKDVVEHRPLFVHSIGIGAAMLAIVSGAPWFKWALYNAPLLESDIDRAKLGIQIRESTDETATIAVHAAGQIPYYSGRPTIDLLGKSDPVVAHGMPAASFRPGHNKWNYEYSIEKLKPDLIADEWGDLRRYLARNSEYQRLGNGVYIRRDSRLLEIEYLAREYKEHG